MTPPAIAARRISKRFAGGRALIDAELTVLPGEIHGLLGQNGSGKSTLVKVLAGYHAPEPGGELEVAGRTEPLPLRPGRAAELGMRFVHQDLALIPSLNVVENLRLDELASARRWFISWPRERRRARETLLRFGVDVDPSAVVAELRPGQRAQLAIVRAVEDLAAGRTAGLLVLDEPTSYLTGEDRDRLFELLRGIAAAGSGVLLVTHDIVEATAIADRITVLRDGRNAGTLTAADADPDRLVALILGDSRTPLPARHVATAQAGRPVARVAGLSGAAVRDLSLELDAGEVVGLTGLAASGFEDVPYLLCGARRARAGRLWLGDDHDLTAMTPARALRAGIALLPGERRDGGVASLSVGANLTLPVLDRYSSRYVLDRRRMRRDSAALLERHDVAPADPGVALGTLSGGNQQRALLAKWIGADPRLLLLDEPTRGVDVGARRRIVEVIRGLAHDGVAVVCASADHEQLSRLCDRVLVFAGGVVAAELSGAGLTEARIGEQCRLAGR